MVMYIDTPIIRTFEDTVKNITRRAIPHNIRNMSERLFLTHEQINAEREATQKAERININIRDTGMDVEV